MNENMTLKEYLKHRNANSGYPTESNENGDTIFVGNSTGKKFNLRLDSFISSLKDIKTEIVHFKPYQDYDEKKWRELAKERISDVFAQSLIETQTKASFVALGKLIAWANSPVLDNLNTDVHIELKPEQLQNAIDKLESLPDALSPNQKVTKPNAFQENVAYKEKSLREFAKHIFSYFYKNDWRELISATKQNPSVINNVNFISHDFEIFKRLIGEFSIAQTKETLTSSNTTRYFDEPIFIDDNKYYYFTTQWNGDGDYSLSFSNLKNYFERKYPEYRLKRKDGAYYLIKLETIPRVKFYIESFIKDLQISGLIYSTELITRFSSSLLAKPFVILTGLSGSGKTKLAQAFAQWICQDESQYRIVPVGADWTNREPLLGYPNALKPEEYVKPDNSVLDLIIEANNQPDLPHFLILDEMNLSHVERYFADFLSVMESKEEIPLYAEGTVENGVPSKLKVPVNLFIIGTVNIDETTNMFSPKVLDRANTIEFRVTKDEMKNFLGNIKDIDMDALTGKGAGMAKSFLEMAAKESFATTDIETINVALVKFFGELKKTGAEYGYRSASEILRLIHYLTVLDGKLTTNQKIDIAIMQKLLPKLHGSRRKLVDRLETLGSFCVVADVKIIKDVFEKPDFDFNSASVLYPLSLEKIARMYRGAIDNGFASFAEA